MIFFKKGFETGCLLCGKLLLSIFRVHGFGPWRSKFDTSDQSSFWSKMTQLFGWETGCRGLDVWTTRLKEEQNIMNQQCCIFLSEKGFLCGAKNSSFHDWYVLSSFAVAACLSSGFPAQHPGQLVELWAPWRLDGGAGRRGGGGGAGARCTEVTYNTLCTAWTLIAGAKTRFTQSLFCLPEGWFAGCPKRTHSCYATCWLFFTVSKATPRRTKWLLLICQCALLPACSGHLECRVALRWREKEPRRCVWKINSITSEFLLAKFC